MKHANPPRIMSAQIQLRAVGDIDQAVTIVKHARTGHIFQSVVQFCHSQLEIWVAL